MKSGGCRTGGNRCQPFDTTEIIDLSVVDDPLGVFPSAWTPTCRMNHPRHFHTLTILPDGKVLATGQTGASSRQVVGRGRLLQIRTTLNSTRLPTCFRARDPRSSIYLRRSRSVCRSRSRSEMSTRATSNASPSSASGPSPISSTWISASSSSVIKR